MPAPKFATIADDLVGCATSVLAYLRNHGYQVRIEPQQLGYPTVPTFSARRAQTTTFIQVGRNPRSASLEAWSLYGKSCIRDTRIVFATDKQPAASAIQFLQQNRIGLYLYAADQVVELLAPHDLAINIGLPDRADFNVKVRRWLAKTYEEFDRGDWAGGFEEACKLLEEKARDYFWTFSSSGRIKIITTNGPVTMSKESIARLSMGQLKDKFDKIVSPTGDDQQIGDALARINPDRIVVAHNKAGRRRLRRNVGNHMWVIITALRIISKYV